MTVDTFANTINEMAEVVKTKSSKEAEKIIIDALGTSQLDMQLLRTHQDMHKDNIQTLQQNVNLVLQFAIESKESMKSQLQDIKKYHKARDSYNNHSGS